MLNKSIYVAVFYLSCQLVFAGSLILKSGETLNVDIVGVKDGKLFYLVEGKVKSVSLNNVSGYKHFDGGVKVSDTKDYQYSKYRSGKAFTVSIEETKPIMKEPYVRAFVMLEATKDGENPVYIYKSNRKVVDPTRTNALNDVDTANYQTKQWFIDKKAIAVHIEVWRDGKLSYQKTEAPDKLEGNWWTSSEVKYTRNLQEVKVPLTVEKEKDEKPKGNVAQIVDVSLVENGSSINVTAQYKFFSDAEKPKIPKAKLHLVTQNRSKELEIETVELEKSSGKLMSTDELNRTLKYRISKTQMNEAAITIPQLVHWRFEVIYEGKVIAEKEDSIKSVTLPNGWYK